MKMKIEIAFPPNIEQIRAKLDIAHRTDIVFTYGDVLYNPHNHEIDRALMHHEETHAKQQQRAGGPEVWWDEYLNNPRFRADEEIEAYRVQFRTIKRTHYASGWKTWLYNVAKELCGPMYGGCVRTTQEAIARITR